MATFPLPPGIFELSHLADLDEVVPWTGCIDILSLNLIKAVCTLVTIQSDAVVGAHTQFGLSLLLHRADPLVNGHFSWRLLTIQDN